MARRTFFSFHYKLRNFKLMRDCWRRGQVSHTPSAACSRISTHQLRLMVSGSAALSEEMFRR